MACGLGAMGFAFWDRQGPQPAQTIPDAALLPGFNINGTTNQLAVVRGSDRTKSIPMAINILGGMAAFVQSGDRVLIKVNAAFASPPLLGATTHPDAVATVIALCRQAGASKVTVTDNPINDPAACFALSGIEEAVRRSGGQLILPDSERFESYSIPNGQLIRSWPVLTEPLRNADKVIALAPVKDHHRSGASMILKNWYGLLGGRRNIFHQQIHAIISELALLVRPTLAILDGTMTMTANGPTGGSLGDLKPTHTVIAGRDPVAIDTYGAGLLDKAVHDLPFLELAQKAGAGTTQIDTLKVTEVNL